MKVAGSVDVVQARDDLLKDPSDETASERAAFSGFDELIEVALHAFKHKVELAGRGEEIIVIQRNDVGMVGYEAEGFELLELATFFPARPSSLHALEGNQTLASPVLAGAGAALHGGKWGMGR
jgi:hypothetical protein